MSRHSKWSKIKHQKGVADVKRAAAFTKLSRIITVAAREGGGDPSFNFKLRSAIDQALACNLPKDNIERAVKKGAGELAGERIEEAVYEGFGPGGIAVIVEALTDNRNRTSGNLRHLFAAHGGNLSGAGSVQWMFDRKGTVRLEGPAMDEEEQLAFIDAGAGDMAAEDDEIVITAAPENLAKIKEAGERAGRAIASVGFEWLPKERVDISDSSLKEKVEALLDALDGDEDVSAVYSNLI